MIRLLLDAIALRFGYVRAAGLLHSHSPLLLEDQGVNLAVEERLSAWPPHPEDHGFTSATMFTATRAGMTSDRCFTFAEVVDFLGACGLQNDEVWLANVLSGWPFEIDGATMSFKAQP